MAPTQRSLPQLPVTTLVLSRITNPTPTNAQLIPPFQQVRVQTVTPVTGGIYNVLFVTVRNSTTQTFDASNNFQVKLSGGKLAVPILTGTEQWKPGQVIVFYILSKKYYPLSPQVSAGFAFNFLGRENVAIPGPSGIFQRIKYDPATINGIINHIVPFGPGAKGHLLGLPDTSIWEFTAGGRPKSHPITANDFRRSEASPGPRGRSPGRNSGISHDPDNAAYRDKPMNRSRISR